MFQDHGGDTAGDLIDQAGLKGSQVGEVEVLDNDPNFFVVQPGAKSADVVAMIEMVKKQVAERLEVNLETAIQIW